MELTRHPHPPTRPLPTVWLNAPCQSDRPTKQSNQTKPNQFIRTEPPKTGKLDLELHSKYDPLHPTESIFDVQKRIAKDFTVRGVVCGFVLTGSGFVYVDNGFYE